MNPAINENHPSRVEVPSPFTGKLVRIHNDENYEDIFGIHLGSYHNTKWDPAGDYTFHIILSCEGVVRNYCLRAERTGMIEVIS